MGAKYDGTIRIDTRIDTDGFNKGISKVGNSMRGLGVALYKTAAGLLVAFAAVAMAVGFIVKGIINLFKSTVDAAGAMVGYAEKVSELKLIFANLKLAVMDAFRPLILFAIPWIQSVIGWITNLLSMVSQVVAALTGQNKVWKSTAKEAAGAAGSAGKLAKNTRKAGEAAEGALAPFDELNVLQMAKEEPQAGGGGGISSGGEWVQVGEKALGLAAAIKSIFDSIRAFFAPLKEPLESIGDSFGRIWASIKLAAGAVWNDLTPAFVWLRDNALKPLLEAIATIMEKIATWAEENPEKMKGVVIALGVIALLLLALISPAAAVIGAILAIIVVIGLLIKYWPELKKAAIETFQMILQGVISFAKKWLETWKTTFEILGNLINLFVNAWDTATKAIGKFFTNIFDGIKLTVKTMINSIILAINNFLSGAVGGINALILSMNKIPGINIQTLTVPQIPYLAKGAVIPPNAEFLAMLGDQRSGRNIEAPEDLIRQIVREETAGMGAGQEITINFAGSLGALVRELKPYIDKANIRTGKSLINGVTS